MLEVPLAYDIDIAAVIDEQMYAIRFALTETRVLSNCTERHYSLPCSGHESGESLHMHR